MDPTIKKILKTNHVDGIFHTHVSLIRPKGKFQFNRQTLEDFWEAYCNFVESNEDPMVGIAEKPQQYLPVLVDVDLRIRDEGDDIGDGLYTEDQLKSVVEVYQSTLRQIVDNCTDDDLVCAVLEKKMYQQTKNEIVYFKHGFHLHFPYIFLNKVDQEIQLIPRVQQAVKDAKLFANLGIEDSGSVIDKVCCKVPWLLYGSRKTEENHPYKLTKIYDASMNKISVDKAFKHYQIFDHKEQPIPMRGKIAYYLPRIFSIVPYGRGTKEIKRGVASPIKEKLKKERKSSANYRTMSVEEALNIARQLLPMIADFRADDRNEWMTIGWCLYNISDGHPDGLDLWCEFSSRCEDKYDESMCIYQWERMTKRDITIGTLRHYASVDNPVEYKKYKEEQANKHIMASLDGSHNDVAKALHAEYSDEFVCASVANKVWFQFVHHKWEQIEEGTFLREKISGKIVDRYIEAVKKLYDDLRGCQDKAREAMVQARIKQVQKMIGNLKSAPYKNNVMKECMEVFYDPRFREKLDSDPYLICFKNGVYDLRMNTFRPGRPEDFLSKNMPINYVIYSEDDEKVQDVFTFLEQVFPDKSVRKYFLDVSSDIFVGGNHEKIVLFWTGEGDNGKSITQLFFELMMGKLAIKLNTNVITGKKPSAGAAFADLARAGGGVRWAVLEEPDADEMINTGIFKHLSGNDTFYARDLFEKGKDGREICPMFKLAFICLAKNTAISLPSGISISIEKLADNNKLLGYDQSRNGITPICQQKLLSQGKRNCITLTLQDGRKITCTPNHKFLTASGKWIQAENVIPGETTLKMTVDNPKCDDIFEESDFKFCDFDINTYKGKMSAMALCRLIGYIITDGTLNKTIYSGHQIDAENILCDIELLCGKRPKIVKNHNVLQISIPEELSRKICSLVEKQTGGKVNCRSNYPDFIFDPKCPLYLVREFLASIFGGDGIVPPVRKNSVGSLQFVASKISEHIESLADDFGKIGQLLKDRFNIDSIVSEPMMYNNNKFHLFLRINKAQDILQFAENIGFRYCCDKTYRITAIASLLRYKNAIITQNQDIITRARALYETTGQTREQAFNQAMRETTCVIDKDHIVTYKCARVHYLTYKNTYKMPSICVNKFLDSTDLAKFINQNLGKGKVHYSVDKEDTVFPCYKMSVVSKEDAGEKDVYDIVAEKPYSNFVAEGIVTHNCNKLPRIKAADKAVWNRVRVVPFEATFCRPDNPAPESYEEQLRQKRFPMDKQFSKKIPGLVEPFAWILLQHRIKIANQPRTEPEKVRAATEIYRRQNDIYRQFVEESIIEDPNKSLTLAELYNMFKDWFKESLPGHSVPVKNEVEEYFAKIWGVPEGKRWKGYRQKTLKDEVDNGDAIILTEDDLVDYSNEKKD
jgi:phage/plasmid-associated DNA primase